MKSKAVWAMVVLNVLLLANLCLRGLTPTAQAQMPRPSDYIMIPGEVSGGNGSVIYMVDLRQNMLAARTLDPQGKVLINLGPPVDLSRIFGNRR